MIIESNKTSFDAFCAGRFLQLLILMSVWRIIMHHNSSILKHGNANSAAFIYIIEHGEINFYVIHNKVIFWIWVIMILILWETKVNYIMNTIFLFLYHVISFCYWILGCKRYSEKPLDKTPYGVCSLLF